MLTIGCLVLGVFGLIYWGLAMFTDTGLGEFAREINAEEGGKNNLSLTMPSLGLMFLFGAVFGFGEPDSVFEVICGSLSVFFMLVAVVSRLPIPLPAWMYPQWHVQWRRERFAKESSWPDTARLGPGRAADHADTLPGSAATNLSPELPGDDT